MSKITFRADDDLVRRLEEFDASKSEVMREALRAYLDGAASTGDENESEPASVDDALSERVDALIAERLDARTGRAERGGGAGRAQDINVNVTLDGVNASSEGESGTRRSAARGRKTEGANAENAESASDPEPRTCAQCGDEMDGEHVYCPNCGEKASHRVFCECGDELRSDWGFCPSCGRRTPAADVLDRS